jgi:ACT domain-containing protein
MPTMQNPKSTLCQLRNVGINIEDISQKIMGSYFVMVMLVDMKDSVQSLEQVRTELQDIGKDLGVQIQIQHENIFKMMHRI